MPYTKEPQSVLTAIDSAKEPYRIYLLTGEEEYFTDKIEKKIEAAYMPEEARDFNYTLLYGTTATPSQLLTAARRAPMMAKYTLTVVREAQAMMQGGGGALMEVLGNLVDHPVPSSIVVLCFKGGKKPARTLSVIKSLTKKEGLYVESPEIRDYQISGYIRPLALEHGLTLTPEAVQVVAEHIGTDVTRLDSELGKLALALPSEVRAQVTPEQVLTYTGLNKEYTAFDLKRALARKDRRQSLIIARSLSEDSKRVPVQMIIPTLFGYFADLLTAYYAPQPRTEQSVMGYLGISSSFFVKDIMLGLKSYKPQRVVEIIHALRHSDARSKGMYSDQGDPDEILIDLVLLILN